MSNYYCPEEYHRLSVEAEERDETPLTATEEEELPVDSTRLDFLEPISIENEEEEWDRRMKDAW